MDVSSTILGLVAISALPNAIPHEPIYLLAFWGAAFVSLCLAVVGRNVFSNFIEGDTELLSLGKELVMPAPARSLAVPARTRAPKTARLQSHFSKHKLSGAA
jgi:hypothetical protein